MKAILAPRGRRLVATLAVLAGLLTTAASARAFFPPQTGGTGTPPPVTPPPVTPTTPPPVVTPPPTVPPVVTPPVVTPPVVTPPVVTPPIISGQGSPPTTEQAPEPASLIMGAVGTGLAGLYAAYRRRRAGTPV
jgi:hypothetical protein